MQQDNFWLSASDTSSLFVHRWLPGTPPRAVVLLVHGMAEHGGRYARLGAALCQAGIGLYAQDQRGHGRTAEYGTLGLFADHNGWGHVLGDVGGLREHISKVHGQTPVILLGHSMGSYIAQAWLLDNSSEVDAAILSGSNFQPPALYRAARLIAGLESWRQGPAGRSALIDFLSFGSFNKAFKPTRTAFDWLSRDTAEVDSYIADPLCGFRCCNQLWLDLLAGLAQISTPANLTRIDPGLPLLIIGGECDPVSDGKRLEDLAGALLKAGESASPHSRAAGQRNLQTRIYPQARHELLNETNRDEVTAHLIAWVDTALRTSTRHHKDTP